MAPSKPELVELMTAAVRELRPDLADLEITEATPLWQADDADPSATSCDLDSLDLLELLIIFEEDHGLMMPDDLEELGVGTTTVGDLAELLLGTAVAAGDGP